MNLFLKYNLWNFFSIMLTYLLKDFRRILNRNLGEKIKISILKDREFGLDHIPDKNWILIKNNIEKTTTGKLRFLISNEDFQNIIKIIEEKKFINIFNTIPDRLKLITGIKEMQFFSYSKLPDPRLLGHIQKYFAVFLSIKTSKIKITLLFIIRDEMLLFPVGRIPLNFLDKLSTYHFKKAFIELDKNIIWDGILNWDKELANKMDPFIKDYPAGKYKLIPGNNEIAYRLFLQYLNIIKLLVTKT